jgi:hypothetical protein
MAGRLAAEEKTDVWMNLDAEDIKLLHSLTPENFAEFRDMFNSRLLNERRIITFCAVS